MKQQIKAVELFHQTYGAPIANKPTLIPTERFVLRHRLMKEENDEYIAAAGSGNLVEVADALGDQLYILCGTMIEHGLQNKMEEVFEEIQRSNMSKLDLCPHMDNAVDSEENMLKGNCNNPDCMTLHRKPIVREDGKVLKGAKYFKPNIRDIINPSHETEDNQLSE